MPCSLTLVIHSNHLIPDLQVQACRGHWNWTDDLDASLAVYRTLSVERRNAWNLARRCPRDEVENILVCLLEGEVDGKSGKGGEVRVELIEEVKLVFLDTNRVGLGRVLVMRFTATSGV